MYTLLRTVVLASRDLVQNIESHPPARERLARIRDQWASVKLIGQEQAFLNMAEGVLLDGWLSIIRSLDTASYNSVVSWLRKPKGGVDEDTSTND